jgi:raffinose/stachyose/melibiose transport system substrate-binding protein
MKRILSAFLAALLPAMSFSACGAENASSARSGSAAAFTPSMDAAASAAVEIVGVMDNFESLEAVIQDFNEIYPNVTVSYAKMDDYSKTMPSKVLGSDPPEIFMSYRSYFLNNRKLTDAMLDLSDMGLDTGLLRPEVAESCMYDGKMLCVPLMLNYQGAAVNTSLLKKEGLEIPATFESFLKTCDTLLQKGYTPLQGFPDYFYPNFLYNEWRVRLSMNADSGTIFTALNTGADGEPLRKSFQVLADYRDKGYFSDSVNLTIKDSYDKAILHFFEGSTPFLICSSETMSGMKKRETKSAAFAENSFSYEFCVLPVTDLGTTAVVDVWNAFSITKNSDQVEWAKEFIRFLFTADELNKMAEIKGLPTVVAAGNGDTRYTALGALTDSQTVYANELSLESAVSATYNQFAKQICTGACTVDEAVEQFPAAVREQLAAAK